VTSEIYNIYLKTFWLRASKMLKKIILPASVVRQKYREAARKRKLELLSPDTVSNVAYITSPSKMPSIVLNELSLDGKIPFDKANALNTDELINMLLISKCLKKSIPKKSTFIVYLNKIAIIRKHINAPPGFEFLKNTDLVINTVIEKYFLDSTKANIFVSLTSICGRIESLEEPYRLYSDFGNTLQKKIQKQTEENVLSPNQEKSWLSWDKILDLAPVVKEMPLQDQLIYGIYTQHPPRRVMDYASLSIFIETNSVISLDTIPSDGNYLVVDAFNVPIGLSIGLYKTSKSYGPYRFLLEKGSILFNLLQAYIHHLPSHGDFLFHNQDEALLSRKIGDIFEKATLKVFGIATRVTANILRHSFISNMVQKSLFKTVALRTEKAFEMGHSTTQQNLYAKFLNID